MPRTANVAGGFYPDASFHGKRECSQENRQELSGGFPFKN
jgi:hypothetical protein